MLKRLLVLTFIALVVIPALVWWFTGIAPPRPSDATALGSGLGAKLFCSGRYISGFDHDRLVDDIATYSGLTRYIEYTEHPDGGIIATLFGSEPVIARYRPGLGCTLDFGDLGPLDTVTPPAVATLPETPWPLGTGGKPTNEALQAILEDILATDNSTGLDTRALLVVQNGVIVAETYAEDIGRDTPLLGWSMGKSLTAMMLGRLELLGQLDVQESGVFPEWRADSRSAITVEDLLQMSSGLDFSEPYIPGNDSVRMLFMSSSAASVALKSPTGQPPSSHFYYSSGTTNLLSLLLYKRSGGTTQALLDFYEHEFAEPLALENTRMELDASGVFVGSSYVYATARDWARFGHIMVNKGEINGHTIVTPEWIARATAPNSSDNYRRYGYQFWLNRGDDEPEWPSLSPSAFAMQGNRKQYVMMLPEQRAVIVRLGWSPGDYPADDRFSRISEALRGR